jgi:gamma-glutamylcysteine synthetase
MYNLKVTNQSGNKERTIGLEFENPVLRKNGEPVSYDEMQSLWQSFVKRNWKPKVDPVLGIIDGLSKDFNDVSASIISDAGAGNFELALSPQKNIAGAKEAYDLVMAEILPILEEHNIMLVGFGMQPGHIADMEDFRRKNSMYVAWTELGSSDKYANETSSAISAHQVGVGANVRELAEITNEIIKVTGLITALCGNSPIHNWEKLPYKEWRIICMSGLRMVSNYAEFIKVIGFPERPFNSLSDILRYYWDTPFMMLPLLRNDQWIIPDEKINFLSYFKKKEIMGHDTAGKSVQVIPEASDVNWASIQFWSHLKPHLTVDDSKITVKEFVEKLEADRLEEYLEDKLTNCYVECRVAGAAPVGEEMAIPSLMVGLVNNLEELKTITQRYTWNDWKELVYDAAVRGLDAEVAGDKILPVLKDFIEVAKNGLIARKFGEEKNLEPFYVRMETGKNPADLALEHFEKSKEDFINFIRYK